MHETLRAALDARRAGTSFLIHADTPEQTAHEADAYLMGLFCEHGTGCGVCSGCIKCAKRIHVDLLAVEGTKVDDVREVMEFAAKRPFEASIKAVYVPAADTLTEQAQNALLKVLEEPPEDTVMVLGAVNMQAVLSTILSRCILVEPDVDAAGAASRIKEATGLPDERIAVLLGAAGGDCAGALALHEQGFLELRDDAAAAVRRILGAKNKATSKIEKLLWREGPVLSLMLRAALLYLADVLSVKYLGPGATVVNEDMRGQLEEDSDAPARSVTCAMMHLHGLQEKMSACKGLNKRLGLQSTLLDILEDIVI